MITLFPKPDFSLVRVGRPAAHAQRNKSIQPLQLSSQQVKVEARRLLAGGLPPRIWFLLDLLSVGGVMTARQLDIPASTLRRWAHVGVLTRLPFAAESVKAALAELGMREEHPLLYTLGPVGLEVATLRHGVQPATGFAGYTLMRVLHDVLVCEVVLRISKHLETLGRQVEWLGKYESVLKDQGGSVILEPDALLRIHHEGQVKAFALEYHNEDKQSRAFEKVDRYERAIEKGLWRERWEVETFPTVLAVFRHAIVGEGYRHQLQQEKRFRYGKYYGKTLQSVLDGKMQDWTEIQSMEKRSLVGKD